MVLYTILIILIYLPMKIMFPVKVVGKHNIPKKKPYVLISNHLSWKDLFIVSINILGYRRFIGKKELGKCFLVRIIVKGIGAILVDRQNVDLTSIRKAVKSLKDGVPLLIFPEGTRNRSGDDLQEIKQGAAMIAVKGGAPIVPAMILKKQRLFRRNYIYIGEPVYFGEEFSGRLDSIKLTAATALMASTMSGAKQELVEFVNQKKQKKSNKSSASDQQAFDTQDTQSAPNDEQTQTVQPASNDEQALTAQSASNDEQALTPQPVSNDEQALTPQPASNDEQALTPQPAPNDEQILD